MENKEENLISHLEALRSMLIKCFIALGIGLIPMFFVSPFFMDWLTRVIIRDNEITFNYFKPMEIFILQIKTAVVLDFLACFPYIIRKVWEFIMPALYENEKKLIKYTVLISTILFIIGISFCIFFILPMIISFGVSFATANLNAVFGISSIITMALWLSVAFGLMFQFPLVTYLLIKFDIVKYEAIKSKRPYIFVGILIMAAILTPTPDIVNQLMLALPTYLLFEIGLFFSRKFRNREISKE